MQLIKGEVAVDNERFAAFVVKVSALAGALSFACIPRLWLQSNHDKPYPLLSFITALIFYLLFQWREKYAQGDEQPAYIYACTFLAGLAMALHQTVVLFLPAWCLLILLVDWRVIKRVKELCLAIAFACLGFAVQLYLPLRATRNPLLNWGDTKTATQFLWHFLRRGYPQEPHGRDFALLWEQLKAFSLSHEFTWLGVALILFALVRLWERQRQIVIVYLVAVGTFLLIIAGYFNTVLELIFLTEEFFTPLYLLSATLVGVGLMQLLNLALTKASLPAKYGAKVYVLVLLVVLSLPGTLCAVNYYENDQHNNYIAYDYAANSLRSLPQDAVMFTWGDSGAFPLWYLQGVERMREDVDLPHTPHLTFDWYLDSLPRVFKNSPLRGMDLGSMPPDLLLGTVITTLIGKRPVFIDFSTRYSVSFSQYIPLQTGIVYRVRLASEPGGVPDFGIWDLYNNRGIVEKISFLDLDTSKAILIYANSYLEAGEYLLSIGRSGEALQLLTKSELISPLMKPSVDTLRQRYNLVGKE